MNKKIQSLYRDVLRLSLALPVLFTLISLFFDKKLAITGAAGTLLYLGWLLITERHRREGVDKVLETASFRADTALNRTLQGFPMPMAAFILSDGAVTWANEDFWQLCAAEERRAEMHISELLPDLPLRWLEEGQDRMPELLELNGKKFAVYGNPVRHSRKDKDAEESAVLYFQDVTDYEHIAREYDSSRPVAMVTVVDNYEELLKPLSDRQKIEMRGKLDDIMDKWCAGRGGIMRRFDRDRYFFIFERRHLSEITENRFTLLDEIQQAVSTGGIRATASIGVGIDGESLEETFSFAALAAEMALSRGGDQAVVKNRFGFEFFGGRGDEVENQSKVRTRVMADALSHLLSDASHIYIMGHRYADLDTVGAAAGLCCIARKLGKSAHIVLGDGPNASVRLLDSLCSLPEYGETLMSPQEAILEADKDTLLIVVDTNRPEQVEDRSLLESCNRVAIVDHHRRAATYIENPVLFFYEPSASSACELTAELMSELLEPGDILSEEADAVLSGIVMDTKNFTIRTGERTFAAAAYLRRSGADTTRVKMLLQNGMEETLARYEILRSTRLYKGMAIAAPKEPQNRVVASQAADELLNIHDVTASVVIYPTAAGGVDLSARSIGSINVQVLLEELGGGGNKSAAGAQMKDISLPDAVNRLFAAIDHYMETDE